MDTSVSTVTSKAIIQTPFATPSYRVTLPYNWTNATHQTSNDILRADLTGIRLSLPWWTALPSACLNIIIAFKSVTADWDRNFGNSVPKDWVKSLRFWEKFKVASQFVEMIYMLVQVFAAVATLGQHSATRGLLRYTGPGSYALLFAASVRLWTKLVFQSMIAGVIAWVIATLSLLIFIIYNLPDIGSTSLYQLWNPWCISSSGSIDCVNASQLGLYESPPIPIQFNWVYAGVVGLSVLWSAYKHIRFHITGKGLHWEQKFGGKIVIGLILLLAPLTAASIYMNYTISKGDYITKGLSVCPGVLNTTANSSGAILTDTTNCVAIQISLPGTQPSLQGALNMDKSNLARLIVNI
ncbi:hypothetical protein B7463_g10693, partial [Scytalidium lignicola]